MRSGGGGGLSISKLEKQSSTPSLKLSNKPFIMFSVECFEYLNFKQKHKTSDYGASRF